MVEKPTKRRQVKHHVNENQRHCVQVPVLVQEDQHSHGQESFIRGLMQRGRRLWIWGAEIAVDGQAGDRGDGP